MAVDWLSKLGKVVLSRMEGLWLWREGGLCCQLDVWDRTCSRVAQWKRAGPITQRSVDRNYALLSKTFFIQLPPESALPLGNRSTVLPSKLICQFSSPVRCKGHGMRKECYAGPSSNR